jgi:TatD DNase family protein
MIDTHSHIYLDDFSDDRREMINRAKEREVTKIILPNIDKESYNKLMLTQNEYEDICLSLNGLHPTSVKKNYKEELAFLLDKFEHHKFIGVGEIGIDLYWDKTFILEQKDAFEMQVDFAIQSNLPIVIHARESFTEIFNSLEKFDPKKLTGVFHSFSGSHAEIEKIKQLGDFNFGINGIVTFKNSTLKHALKAIGLQRILLETDAPYLAPVPFRGKRNEPAYLYYICKCISENFDVSPTEVDRVTTLNAKTLFNII